MGFTPFSLPEHSGKAEKHNKPGPNGNAFLSTELRRHYTRKFGFPPIINHLRKQPRYLRFYGIQRIFGGCRVPGPAETQAIGRGRWRRTDRGQAVKLNPADLNRDSGP
jgi:hypothetical protein